MEKIRLGIIICDRHNTCAGGKCFRALQNRDGAFEIYKNQDVELVGYTSCGGCPGGNIEYAPEEMIKNGATHIHFATGFLVGYPPCPYLEYFRDFISINYGMNVIMGTHPIPQKYLMTHQKLNTWNTPFLTEAIEQVMSSESKRVQYD